LVNPAKQETIVVLAHRDHMGKLLYGTLFRGAADNASGVSAVIEIAREVKSADLKKAIVFLAVDDEEIGGIGARDFEAGFQVVVAEPEDLGTDHIPATRLSACYLMMDSISVYLHKRSDGPEAVDFKELCATTVALASAIRAVAK
jgi:hypothetical protein